MMNVVAALLEKDGKILIARRNHGDEEVYGKWEFPGGKVNDGETEEHALEREFREEFELTIKTKEYITHNVYYYTHKVVDLKLYRCEYISGEFHLHDHFEYKFVTKDELLNYDFCPADVDIARYVVKL